MGFFTAQRLKKMKQSFRAKQLSKAVSYAEKLDPSEVRTAYDLSMMADIYMCAEDYEAAKKVYAVMYNRNKSSRICKQLVKLCIKQGKVKEALQYVKELKRIDEEDYERFIFQYQIGKKLGQEDEYLLACLLKVREADYIDVWALELAKLYYKMGKSDECINECRNIKLWFPETQYAEQADAILEACANGTPYETEEIGDDVEYSIAEETVNYEQSTEDFEPEQEEIQIADQEFDEELEQQIAENMADFMDEEAYDDFETPVDEAEEELVEEEFIEDAPEGELEEEIPEENVSFEEDEEDFVEPSEDLEEDLDEYDSDEDEISMEEYLARKNAQSVAPEEIAFAADIEAPLEAMAEETITDEEEWFSEEEAFGEAIEDSFEEAPVSEENFDNEYQEEVFDDSTYEEESEEYFVDEVSEDDALDNYDPEEDELSEEEMLLLLARKKASPELQEMVPAEEPDVYEGSFGGYEEPLDPFFCQPAAEADFPEETTEFFENPEEYTEEVTEEFIEDEEEYTEEPVEDYFEEPADEEDYFDEASGDFEEDYAKEEFEDSETNDILAAFNKNFSLDDKPKRTIDDEIKEGRNRVELTTHTLVNDSLTSDVLAALLEQEQMGKLGEEDAVDASILKMLTEEEEE